MISDFSHYNIYRSDSGVSGTFFLIGSSSSGSFSDTTAVDGNTYYYYITTVTYYLLDDLVNYEESSPSNIFSIEVDLLETGSPSIPLPIVPPFMPTRGPDPDNGHRIGTYDYITIAETISEAYDLGKQSLSHLSCMFNNLQITDINVRQRHKTELESFLRSTYSYIIYRHLDNQQSLYSAVRGLNDHVLREYGQAYGYEDLDEFLIDQFLEVPLTYAILSDQVGQSITVIGDSKARWSDINISWKDIDLPYNRIGWENL